MANAETIINSMRNRCTRVFEVCQENLPAAIEDKEDFIAEEGVSFFTDWFNTVSGYDIEFQDMADAIAAMETLQTTFESVRAKLQVVRLR